MAVSTRRKGEILNFIFQVRVSQVSFCVYNAVVYIFFEKRRPINGQPSNCDISVTQCTLCSATKWVITFCRAAYSYYISSCLRARSTQHQIILHTRRDFHKSHSCSLLSGIVAWQYFVKKTMMILGTKMTAI